MQISKFKEMSTILKDETVNRIWLCKNKTKKNNMFILRLSAQTGLRCFQWYVFFFLTPPFPVPFDINHYCKQLINVFAGF